MPMGIQKISPRTRRQIRITYVCLHVSTGVLGVALIASAFLTQKAEKDSVDFLQLNLTMAVSILFFVVGGVMLLGVLLGVLGLFFENGYLWIAYSMLMAIVCLTAVAGAGSAIDQQGGAPIRLEMRNLMGRYKNNQTQHDVEVNRKVDHFQRTYKCCGIDNYSNWQDFAFGRTSLRVPRSCCKPFDGTLTPEDEFCGDLCLPDHHNLTNYIYSGGCYQQMSSGVKINIIILGCFGIITFLLTGFIFTWTCYLIISKKIDTR